MASVELGARARRLAQLGWEAGTALHQRLDRWSYRLTVSPANKTPMSRRDGEADCGRLAMLGWRRGLREPSKITGPPENIITGRRYSP